MRAGKATWQCLAATVLLVPSHLAGAQTQAELKYRNARAPLEQRVDDLLWRMTLQEKVRQLDMYSSAREIMSAHTDDTHSALDATFVPEKAQTIWGDLGSGAIVVLGTGEWQGVEGEGFDRTNLDLPGNQEPLLEAIYCRNRQASDAGP